jgi:hypothetical protein
MRAIGPRGTSHRALCTAAVAILSLPVLPGYADSPRDVLATVNYVATALAADNAIDAMTPFDKSFTSYAKLRDYFSGLTDSSQIVNEVDFTDEQDSDSQSSVTVDWTLTLTNKTTLQTERRNGEVHIRLTLQNEEWKIIDFSPIDLFNPQPKQQSK